MQYVQQNLVLSENMARKRGGNKNRLSKDLSASYLQSLLNSLSFLKYSKKWSYPLL